MNKQETNVLADALEALARTLRVLGEAPIPSSPEAACVGIIESDEQRAAAMFEGKHIVTLPDIRRVTGWTRFRVMDFFKSHGVMPLERTNEKQAYEWMAVDVWRVLYGGREPRNGVDMNILPPSRKRRKSA